MFHAVWYLISVMSWFFLNICNYFLLTLVEFGLLPGVLPCLFSPILLFCLMFNFLYLCTMCCSRFMRNQGDILWWWWSACMFVYNQHISHFLSKKNLPPYTLLSSYRTWNNIWLEILYFIQLKAQLKLSTVITQGVQYFNLELFLCCLKHS